MLGECTTSPHLHLVAQQGITKGMKPPPPVVSSLTTVLCVSLVGISFFFRGKSGTVLAVAAFSLLVLNLVAIRKPTFSMLASTLFGLFYCGARERDLHPVYGFLLVTSFLHVYPGWLPSFWVKLRLLPMLSPDMPILPALVAPLTGWTVGLVATFTSAACVVAADTGAYFVGGFRIPTRSHPFTLCGCLRLLFHVNLSPLTQERASGGPS